MKADWQKDLAAWWPDEIRWNVSMADYSTLRAGGKATALIRVGKPARLKALVCWLEAHAVPWRVIGRGSNILVREQGFAGVLLRLEGDFVRIEHEEQGEKTTRVRAGAACTLGRLVAWSVRRGLSGLEFAVGIPGSVGGAVRMNAGAWGGAMGDSLLEITLLNRQGEECLLPRSVLTPCYRTMLGPGLAEDGCIITSASFALSEGQPAEVQATCNQLLQRRWSHQPRGVASAGSFFKNPAGDSAGRLIEAAGLKGLRRGDAMISQRHANFLVNTGAASAGEILELMAEVQERVYDLFGIRLEPEVHLL